MRSSTSFPFSSSSASIDGDTIHPEDHLQDWCSSARSPVCETERLTLLRSLNIWETIEAPELDRITTLVAQVLQAPTVLLSLVGETEQRFASRVGFGEKRTELGASVCATAILQSEVFEIIDLAKDSRFADNRLVHGEPHFRYYAGAPLIAEGGYPIGTLCVLDVVPRQLSLAQKEQLTAFARLAMDQIALRGMVGRRDPVSGLFNRQQFNADLDALAKDRLEGNRQLVIIDIMDLPLAYRFGQAMGMGPIETLIRKVALRLKGALLGDAEVYHVAVARFAFVLPVSQDRAKHALREAVTAVTDHVEAEGLILTPIFHGGIAPFDAHSAGDALRKSVTALQQALDRHALWHYYDPEGDAQRKRQYQLAADVVDGLGRGEFRLLYQPRVRLIDGRIVSAEALIRWSHPTLGEVSPAEFIPIVAGTPAIRALTDWVIEQVCQQQQAWEMEPLIPVSINVSASDFEDGRLLERLLIRCAAHHVSPARFEIEITEGEWLADNPRVLEQLSSIRQAGIRVAIDDFGVGYSNFSYLYSIPFDVLKIDQGLVRGFLKNDRQWAMLSGVIRLSQRLDLAVVAEGVETQKEHEHLMAYGCGEAQGFFYAEPLPADLLRALVNKSMGQEPFRGPMGC